MKRTYFIAGGGFVKIGSSANPERRVKQISTNCPFRVSLIRVMDGIEESEAKRIAFGLSLNRPNGEWFVETPALMEWINTGKIPRIGIQKQEIAQSPVISMYISGSELPETTKDFLIAHSAAGKSVPEVIAETLDAAAARDGFKPHKAA